MHKLKHIVLYLGLPVAIILLWVIAGVMGLTNPLLLPSPFEVLKAAAEMTSSGELLDHILASLARALSGFCISSVIALTLAWLFSRHRDAKAAAHLVLEAIRVVPPLSLVPLLILWLGIGEAPKLTIVILASFFPVYLSALTGFSNLDGRYAELAQSLKLTRSEKFFHIDVPASLPSVITGLRLGFGYAWRALVGAELIAASSGLGYLIEDASEMSRSDRMLVGILSIAILGIAADAVFALAARKLAPWNFRRKTASAKGAA